MDSANRTLTDADVGAIADALEERLVEKFYRDLGQGVWGYVWKLVMGAVLAITAYGAVRGWR